MIFYAAFSPEADTDISKAEILKCYPPYDNVKEAQAVFRKDFNFTQARLYSYELDEIGEPHKLFEVRNNA